TFTMFIIADALSLFASATSVLIFIGILTSRYAEKDFIKSLPWKVVHCSTSHGSWEYSDYNSLTITVVLYV
ncbi:ankyrin repeat protein, partial [Trifolium medium]|nr:ankyrin repeat protein [Trifolium medium]